jgi:adenine-specific DNA-methyltransferase
MIRKQKLELTWIGKDVRPRLEPRILLEETTLSYHAPFRISDGDIFDNRVICGDNLLALKALEQEFAGKVKCIYIDPPFNTGQALEHYDDSVEHSLWLSLINERLQLLYQLLCDEGFLWIHLDNMELHYCKILLDEIFGRQNFVTQITYERSGSAGIGQGGFIVNTAEYILLYKKDKATPNELSSNRPLELETMKRYSKILASEGERTLVREFQSKSNGLPVKVYKHRGFEIKSISLRNYKQRQERIRIEYTENFQRIFRTTNPQKENSFQHEIISGMDKNALYSVDYVPSRGKYKDTPTTLYYANSELFAWLKDSALLVDNQIVKANKLTDVWVHADIPKADLANEGGVDFRRGKKPENLLKRIIEFSTQPGDLVLDSFAGSGTTGAVAHKMKRRWIMVELGGHCHTHIVPRLRKVIDGTDMGGITSAVNWQGGGGFRYFNLAPSLLEKDKWGNWVINTEYNPAMLAEALCKLEGFTYQPSDTVYWQHGYSTERDFIYVTTQHLSAEQLDQLNDEVGTERTLLVLCFAFRGNPNRWPSLTVKKIPKQVLSRCEWGHDDYSLKMENLPQAPPKPGQQPLFNGNGDGGKS